MFGIKKLTQEVAELKETVKILVQSINTPCTNLENKSRKHKTHKATVYEYLSRHKEEIMLLSKNGMSRLNIAKKYNVSETSVGRLLRGELNHISINPNDKPYIKPKHINSYVWCEKHKDLIKTLRANDYTLVQIGEKLGIHSSTISRFLNNKR